MGSDYNTQARLTNNSLATSPGVQLVPLRTSRNADITNFPVTKGDIDLLSCWSASPAFPIVINVYC